MDSQKWRDNLNYTSYDYQRAKENIRKEAYSRPMGLVAYWNEGPRVYARLANWKASGSSLQEAILNLAQAIGKDFKREVNPDLELSLQQKFPKDPHEMYPEFDKVSIVLFLVLTTLLFYVLKHPNQWLYVLVAGIISIVVFKIWFAGGK